MELMKNPIRTYAWGSTTMIPDLLGRPVDGSPQAEMWLGAHPGDPSAVGSSQIPLDELIAKDPAATIGPHVRDRFGDRLPFLLKVLAAGAPLSLQVHPTQAQAEEGFAAEERAGVPAQAVHRRYKDPYHKPEMVVALSRFEGLCGFRHPHETASVLDALDVPGLQAVRDELRGPDAAASVRSVFRSLLTDAEGSRALVERVTAACEARLVAGSPHQVDDDTVVTLSRAYPGDPGVLVALMLNRVTLEPGEALYLAAGQVHAYLEGSGIEVMACSDNVLRGGLTPKHVDVPELLEVVDFVPAAVPYVQPHVVDDVASWTPGADEFALHRVVPGRQPSRLSATGPRIVLCVAGAVTVSTDSGKLELARGASAFLADADGPATFTGAGAAFVAAVPDPAQPSR